MAGNGGIEKSKRYFLMNLMMFNNGEPMKKIMLICATLLLASTASALDKSKMSVAQIEAEVETRVSKAETLVKYPMALNDILQELDHRSYLYYVSQPKKHDATQRLAKIYSVLDDELTNTANKRRIIGIIGLGNNGPEAHEFILSVLENGPELYRKEALGVLYGRTLKGDDIYNKVKDLIARKVIRQEDSLFALKGVNPKRATKEIQDFLATTKDPEQYIKKGGLLSEYGEPDLMDVVIDRYDYFKSIPQAERPDHYDPTLAFNMDMLKKYIQAKEGARLKKALEMFDDSGVFGDMKMPVIQEKLESKDVSSREAAVDFLVKQIDMGTASERVALPILKAAHSREINPRIKNKLKQAIDRKEKSGARTGR
jgi:hypothetical protein